MYIHRKINSAIESFDNWRCPWLFFSSVSALLESSALDELKRIWKIALQEDEYLSWSNLEHGCSVSDASLSTNYPWLSPEARRQLVRGASFQWR
jgi:hypothetical protein